MSRRARNPIKPRRHPGEAGQMTRKKPVRVPTDEDVIRIFTGQPFKRFLGANLPADANVEGFAAGALAGAKVFIRDAVIEKQHKTTKERPLMSPRGEAALAFVMGLEMDYLLATGEM